MIKVDSFDEFDTKTTANTLYVFDIDETLFRTTAKIRVVNSDGRVIDHLTNSQFNDYALPKGCVFDFTEFRDSALFYRESSPIKPMLAKLIAISRNIRNSGSGSKIIMNTAREDFDDKEPVLQKFRDHGVDIDSMHIHRSGNVPGDMIPAHKKNIVLRQYLAQGGYKRVEMFDDGSTNLQVFKSLSAEFPGVMFVAWKVNHDGSIKKF